MFTYVYVSVYMCLNNMCLYAFVFTYGLSVLICVNFVYEDVCDALTQCGVVLSYFWLVFIICLLFAHTESMYIICITKKNMNQ